MKQLSLICFVIVGIVFVAGCIGGEKATDTKTSTVTQTNQKSDVQTPDLIIKQSDVLGLAFVNFNFISIPKSSSYSYNDYIQSFNMTAMRQGKTIVESNYKDVLSIGNRNVGQQSVWEDQAGRQLIVLIRKFDSNSGISESFVNQQKFCENIKTGNTKKPEGYLDEGCGSPNIGDFSYYTKMGSPDVATTTIVFNYRNYMVQIQYIDEKENSLNEAIRIAKIVNSRLD